MSATAELSNVGHTKANGAVPKTVLNDLSPDYVMKVAYETDKETKSPSAAAQMDLARLVKTLDVNGFSVNVRPDTFSTILVFIKLSDDLVSRLAKNSQAKDWIYGVTSSESDSISVAQKLRLIYDKLTGPKSEGGCEITIGEGNWNFVTAVLPLANYSQIIAEKERARAGLFKGAFDTAQSAFLLENFGSKYAFYFGFLTHYLKWLMVFSLVGVISNIFFGRFSKVYAVFNIAFAVSFYLFWKVKQTSLAREWGVENVGVVEISRASNASPDPEYKTLFKAFLFTPVALTSALTLFAYQMGCFFIEIFLTELYDGPGKGLLALVPTILLSIIVPIVTIVYTKVVNKYLNFESHQKKSTFHFSYIIKLFVINFLTSYMALIITAFIYLPFGYQVNPYLTHLGNHVHNYVSPRISVRQENYEINKLRLNNQYQFFVVTNQVVGCGLEFVLPVVLKKVFALPFVKSLTGANKVEEPVHKDDENEAELLEYVRNTLALPPLDINDEYRQLVLQFGFLALFGPIWSIGPLVSTIINIIQYKLDYLKLLGSVRTPIPDRADGIYPWDGILKFLISVGSIVSVAITLLYNHEIVSSASRPGSSSKWWFVAGVSLVVEHIVSFVISTGEKVISTYLTQGSSTFQFKRDYAKKIHGESLFKNAPSNAHSNDVDELLKSASNLPQTLFTQKKVSEPTLAQVQAKLVAESEMYNGKSTVTEKISSPADSEPVTPRGHSYAALAQSTVATSTAPPKTSPPQPPVTSTPVKQRTAVNSTLDPKTSLTGVATAVPVAVATAVPQTAETAHTPKDNLNSDDIVTATLPSGFDLQKGDRVITVPTPDGNVVQAVIDDNSHFTPPADSSFARSVDDSDASYANTTADSANLSSSKLKKKKSKMALKSIFKKTKE
ncbi:unnamed protein product [Kuraishia capsulata CBS 1993]|uniref:Uncharacterized protein n=1 Tax=Kuraishia capsulata CBS 1993 TaxID=1382522 RepID=W6MIQ1_9ASCO|nr:uncharacterized protein KUCA_T00001783001 [Kuraishia capsulata CBS 1993]CDK25813.1 unnamed protein product [Kuraishia capsulata CBS 1993]